MNWLGTMFISIATAIGSVFGIHHTVVANSASPSAAIVSNASSTEASQNQASSPTPISDEQAIKNVVMTVLSVQKSIITFQDIQNMISNYYSSIGIQKFQTMKNKMPVSQTLQNGIVSLFKKMPPSAITFTSVDISGNIATATIPYPGVTYGTMNGKPVGNPLRSVLSISLTKENGSWKINSLSEITSPAIEQ